MPDYDLAVIGAGIHGAAIALEAARRGCRVLVLEQYAQAGLATSSKSSKLIHGGLRYLESGQFRLVRECLHERRRLLAEHPDLVSLEPFHIPVYRQTRRRPWLIAVGLSLYALLGGRGFHRLPRREWSYLDGLKTADLTAVFRYWDARTDDRALTGRLIAQAQQLGADVHYATTFTGAACNREVCRLTVRRQDAAVEYTARQLVNATGPWVNRTLAKIDAGLSQLGIELVQGTHILVPVTQSHGIYYLESPHDRRAVFVMPWRGQTLIGTTETPYRGDPARVAPLETEISYLLDTWNHYFEPALPRTAVIDSFAGLRVLPASDGKPFDRSRDTRLHRDSALPNVLSVYGGKLTSHRLTAERVIRTLDL
jgi:glycerol-3-phosphate dehydrogenase